MKVLEWAYGVGSRRGDFEGAACSLLIIIEELSAHVSPLELDQINGQLQKLLKEPIQSGTRQKIERGLNLIKSSGEFVDGIPRENLRQQNESA